MRGREERKGGEGERKGREERDIAPFVFTLMHRAEEQAKKGKAGLIHHMSGGEEWGPIFKYVCTKLESKFVSIRVVSIALMFRALNCSRALEMINRCVLGLGPPTFSLHPPNITLMINEARPFLL